MSENDWVALSGGVAWRSPPLLNIVRSRDALVARYGPPFAVDLDSNGVGPFDAWAVRFACGLEVCLWWFHWRPDCTNNAPGDDVCVEVYSNARDESHLLFHLGSSAREVVRCDPDPLVRAPESFRLVRQDDNGCVVEIAAYSSACEAEASARAFERRGHKQLYWVEASTAG